MKRLCDLPSTGPYRTLSALLNPPGYSLSVPRIMFGNKTKACIIAPQPRLGRPLPPLATCDHIFQPLPLTTHRSVHPPSSTSFLPHEPFASGWLTFLILGLVNSSPDRDLPSTEVASKEYDFRLQVIISEDYTTEYRRAFRTPRLYKNSLYGTETEMQSYLAFPRIRSTRRHKFILPKKPPRP